MPLFLILGEKTIFFTTENTEKRYTTKKTNYIMLCRVDRPFSAVNVIVNVTLILYPVEYTAVCNYSLMLRCNQAPHRTVLALFTHTAPRQHTLLQSHNKFTLIRGSGSGNNISSFSNLSQL